LEQRFKALEKTVAKLKSEKKELRRLQDAVASTINAIGFTDLQGKMIYLNSSCIKMWGYDHENEFLGKSLLEFWEGDDVFTAIKELKEKGIASGYGIGKRKDGSLFDVQFSINIFKDEAGNPAFMFGSFFDITARKRAEAALRESEEKYRNILESMEEGYYEVDLAGNLTFFNDSILKFIGYSKEELLGMNNREYTTPEIAKRVYQIFNRVYRTGEPQKIADFEFIRKDGTTIALEASVALIRDRGNRRVGFRGICRDITERRRAEELSQRLETQNQQLQKLESIGILASGIAHDFYNLLARILGYIDIVKDDVEPECDAYDILLNAETECMGARALTERFQDFSGDPSPTMNTGPIADLIKDTQITVLSGANVESEFSIHDDLSWVRIDNRLVSKAINNLILNAVESMPDGGIVRICAEDFTIDETHAEPGLPPKPGKYVRVSIQDEGIGISDEDLPRIFDPYFSTKGREFQQGMGFGLSIAYSIIKKHNGYIYVSSQVGIGTTACIYLPAVEEKNSTS